MSPTPVREPLRVGDVVEVPEEDYCYGLGTLVLRITGIGRIEEQDDGRWLDLRGVELRPDGTPRPPVPRYALVRVAAIRIRTPPRRG